MIVRIERADGRTVMFDTVSFTEAAPFGGANMLTEFELGMRDQPEPGLWLVANWHRVGGTEQACTAEGVPVATRSRGEAFMLADSSELEDVRRVAVDGEDAYLRIDGRLCDMAAFGNAVRVHLGAPAGGIRRQIRDLASALGGGTGEVPDVPGVPAELVERLMREQADDGADEIKEEWGDLDEKGW